MSEIKRYGVDMDGEEYEFELGSWVMYSDHAAEVARLGALLPRWVNCNERLPEPDSVVVTWTQYRIQLRNGAEVYARFGGSSPAQFRWWGMSTYFDSNEVECWLEVIIPPLPAGRGENGGEG